MGYFKTPSASFIGKIKAEAIPHICIHKAQRHLSVISPYQTTRMQRSRKQTTQRPDVLDGTRLLAFERGSEGISEGHSHKTIQCSLSHHHRTATVTTNMKQIVLPKRRLYVSNSFLHSALRDIIYWSRISASAPVCGSVSVSVSVSVSATSTAATTWSCKIVGHTY